MVEGVFLLLEAKVRSRKGGVTLNGYDKSTPESLFELVLMNKKQQGRKYSLVG